MSGADDQIRQICEIFDGKVSLTEVERVFHLNGNDSDMTIDQLLAGQLTQSDIKQQDVKKPLSVQSGAKGTNLKKNPSNFRTDKEAFQYYCEEFRDILPEADLNEIWQYVTREYWQDKIDVKTKYTIAKENAQQKIQWLVDLPPVLVEENKNKSADILDIPNPEHDFQQYSQLFQGVLPFNYLQIIWNNLDNSLSPHEKQQIGVLYALDLLEQDQLTNISSFPLNEKTLQEIIKQQEKIRLDSIQRKSSMKVTIKHGKNSQNPRLCSSQQMVKFMITELFTDSNSEWLVTSQLIDELLILYTYDIDTVIEEICTRMLQHGQFHRPNLSYANIVQSNGVMDLLEIKDYTNNNDALPDQHCYNQRTSAYSSSISSSSSSGKISYSSIAAGPPMLSPSMIAATVTNQNNNTRKYNDCGSSSSSSARIRSQKQQTQQLRFGEYFQTVFQRHNPDIRITLQPMIGELKYEGSNHFQSVTQCYRPSSSSAAASSSSSSSVRQREEAMHMVSIVLDFHNLPVLQVLQIVGSAVDYYRIEQRSWILGNTHIKRIMLKFVVGKGLHSPGGVAKLGPAVQKFLKKRNEKNVVMYEGEILLVLQLQKKF